MPTKMIILNGVTVKTLEADQVNEAVSSLRVILPDANIVVIDVIDQNAPIDNIGEIE